MTFRRAGVVAAVGRVVSIGSGAVDVASPGGGGSEGMGCNGETTNATRQVGVCPRITLSL